MNLEDFKEIPNFSRYLISPNGEVWDKETQKLRNWRNNEGVIIIPSAHSDSGKKQNISVRRVVYQVFVDENLSKRTQVESIDGNFMNNHYTNIQPVIRKEAKRRNGFLELSVDEGVSRRGLDKVVRSVWNSMMVRCYTEGSKGYERYGGVGVTVCDDWHVFENFKGWFVQNYIEGFAMDKDLIVDGNKQYCPSNCVFIPKSINSLLAHQEVPVVERYKRGSYTLRCYIAFKYVVFKGWSEEECLEQYHLVRTLQLEKLVHLMKEYHASLKLKYPTTPEIDSRVLGKLESMTS